ncbi:hypothetical protein GY45DRAFT_218305 [Cubamyces sp. BRFM 1775]|nr:hypothetical protein GY45DRAFT_218305 [Cubamyces sp. BRFM 1775]
MQPAPRVLQDRGTPGRSALEQPPIVTLHVESDSPESATEDEMTTRRQRAHRKISSRPKEPRIKDDSARVKGAARRRRAKETRLQSAGPQTCKWNGCGECLSDGNQIWEHMKIAHGANRDGRLRTAECIKTEDEDMEIDELADDDPLPSAAKGSSGAGPRTHTQLASSWFDKVRCRWEGCRSEIQYIGLRRHIESKHIPVRGARCPKGCGYESNRADMLGRHVRSCQFAEEDAVLEDSE